jgi:hypothetical protein
MKSFWDLSEIEQMKVTREEMHTYEKLELMMAGITLPTPPKLQEVNTIPEPDTKVYCIGNYAFKTRSDADAVRKSIIGTLNYEYETGYHRHYVDPSLEVAINESDVYSLQQYNDVKSVLKERRSIEATNEAERDRARKEQDKADKATKNLWDTWTQLQNRKRELEGIFHTLTEYNKLTNQNWTLSVKFLSKTVDIDTIYESILLLGSDSEELVRDIKINIMEEPKEDREEKNAENF